MSTHENLSPLWESRILAYGLDINQRTLNLKFFEWPFFLTPGQQPWADLSVNFRLGLCSVTVFTRFLFFGLQPSCIVVFLLQHAKQPKCYLYNSFEIYTSLSAFFIYVLAFVWPLLLGQYFLVRPSTLKVFIGYKNLFSICHTMEFRN